MASGKITLVYFDKKGRAEATRLLLHAAGREFEDKRISLESWLEFKPTTLYGQLPMLEIDGKRYGQSHAFNRYLAEELGLNGKTHLDGLTIGTVAGFFEDIIRNIIKASMEPDPAKREALMEAAKGDGTRIDGYLEDMLKENGTGYFVGDSLTLADIYALDIHTGSISEVLGAPADNFPLLKANLEKTKSNPGIAKYLASKE